MAYLYWVYTCDHHEDWFVYARSSVQAREFHENYVGYDPGEARSSSICRLPSKLRSNLPSYAPYEDLALLGVKIVHRDYPAVFEKDGIRFREGAVVDDIYTAATDNIAGLYVLQMRDTEFFEIGVTTNLRRRILSLKTANPTRFAVTCFVEVKEPSRLESKLHFQFRKNRQEGEWFRLQPRDLKRLHTILEREVKAHNGRFHLNRLKPGFAPSTSEPRQEHGQEKYGLRKSK
jgi:Meiotically Up-regulated Gene 113 (MUG113) protein